MEWLERLKLAWRILTGRAVMYRLETQGTVNLVGDQDVHVVECRFRPGTVEYRDGSHNDPDRGCG